MSQVVTKNMDAQPKYWCVMAAVMGEIIDAVLSSKAFEKDSPFIDDAVRLFELALKGYPCLDPFKVEAYGMVRGRMKEALLKQDLGDISVIYHLVCWRNIIQSDRIRSFSSWRDSLIRPHVEQMQLFFQALQAAGEEQMAHERTRRDDE
ncbi:MAG TPA: hypothetical protein VJJ72_02275 [Candidatus Paceibacterota bacterium]